MTAQREIKADVREHRSPSYEITSLFVNRWSPRAMTGESLEPDEFMPLFEAARWAPSSYNNQPWRFLFATRTDDQWESYLDLLSEFNREWAKRAAVLVVIVSKTTFDYNGEPARTHSFDTGAAWQSMALEGAKRDLAVRGIGGFNSDRALELLSVPADHAVEAMAAIGIRESPPILPEDMQKDEMPSNRKSLEEIVIHESFDSSDPTED